MITITKRFTFEACHSLPYYKGACNNLHGHSYKLEVTVTGDLKTNANDSEFGMIMDLKELKNIVNEYIINIFDHSNLNEYFENPTAEIMVAYFGELLKDALPSSCSLVSVKLWETETGYAEYTTSKHI